MLRSRDVSFTMLDSFHFKRASYFVGACFIPLVSPSMSPPGDARSRRGLRESHTVRGAFRAEDGRGPDVVRGGVRGARAGRWLVCQRE